MLGSDDLELLSVEECRRRCDWPECQEAIQSELDSLAKYEVFGPVVQIPNNVKSDRYINGILCEGEMREMNCKIQGTPYCTRILSTTWCRL